MPDSRLVATGVGFVAVLMWSLVAVLTAASGRVPPFLLSAMAFAVAGLLGLVWVGRRSAWAELRQPWPAWLHGVGGLFGFHFFFFTAIRLAPPVEATLINYTWPLLIVLFSAALPGERLRWFHVAGGLCGLAGTAIVVGGSGGGAAAGGDVRGYLAAVMSALIWSVYSVTARRFPGVPTGAVTGFCLATAVLSGIAHLALETTVWPAGRSEWAAVLGLGLMPVGAAFYFWDYALKRGDIRVIGVSAYAAPLLSSLLLVAAGYGEPRLGIVLAAILITGGAVLASLELLRARPRPPRVAG